MSHADLNFLYLVDALYQEGSVSRAAEKLNLTQPAVSHALRRLRIKFGDSLFVRSGAGMVSTPAGERIALGARRALDLIQADILDGSSFEPLHSQRTFVVGMSDMGGTVILPRVIRRLSKHAAGIQIKPIAVRPDEVSDMIEKGTIDLAWGYFGNLNPKLYQQTLFRRPLVGIRRKSTRKSARIGFEAFVNTPHVMAAATAASNELLRQKLKEQGRTLHVVMECPYILAVPTIVASTDYIATVPDELAELFLRLAEIEIFKLPLAIPDIGVKQHWHARYNDDAAHQWFRSFVYECLSNNRAGELKP